MINNKRFKVLGISVNDKLSRHFTLKEFLVSQTAKRKGITNIPNEEQVKNMKVLCTHLLEKIRAGMKKNYNAKALLMITSGFRSAKLNKAIGGSKRSQHLKGQAVDMHMWGASLFDTFKYIICDSGLEFDQCIWEYGGWIHISYNPHGINRNEILSVKKVKSNLWKKNKWRLLTKNDVNKMQSENDF